MYPWRRILVPTDFSTASRWVFDSAIRAAGQSGAEIVVLHVRITQPSNRDALRFPADASVYEYVEQQELEVLRRHIHRADENLRTRLIVRTGPDVASEIAATAEDEEVDLIVMATHARHHIPHLLIGSTTLKVLGNCSVPILAIRYGIRKPFSMERLLVVVDDHSPPPEFIEWLEALPVTEVIFAATTEESEPEAQARLSRWRALVPRIATRSLMVDSEREVLRTAENEGCPSIVLTPRCETERAIRGVSDYVVRHADRPVFIVPNRASPLES
jgi:nucleotide-binding universal stress UspA family protein